MKNKNLLIMSAAVVFSASASAGPPGNKASAPNGVPFVTINDRLDAADQRIVALQNRVDSLTARVTELESHTTLASSTYVASAAIGGEQVGCSPVTLATQNVRIDKAGRVVANGSGVYRQNGSNLNAVLLSLVLEAGGNPVAVSNLVPVSAPNSAPSLNNGSAYGAVGGVLYAGSDPALVAAGGSEPFVAAAGNYTLKLIADPVSSPCPGVSFFNFITLSHLRGDEE